MTICFYRHPPPHRDDCAVSRVSAGTSNGKLFGHAEDGCFFFGGGGRQRIIVLFFDTDVARKRRARLPIGADEARRCDRRTVLRGGVRDHHVRAQCKRAGPRRCFVSLERGRHGPRRRPPRIYRVIFTHTYGNAYEIEMLGGWFRGDPPDVDGFH